MSTMLVEEFIRRRTGEVTNHCNRLRRRIPWPECGAEVTTASLKAHRKQMNRTKPEIDWNRLLVSQTRHQIMVYQMSFPGYPCDMLISASVVPWCV